MKLIVSLIVYAIGVFVTAYLLPGIDIAGFESLLLVTVVLLILKAILRPILLLITLPINVLTLGLFTFVINGVIILLASNIVSGFQVENFWWAMLFSLVLSIIVGILEKFDGQK